MSQPEALSNLETLSRISEAVGAMGEPPEELVWPDFEIHEHELLDSQSHRGLAGRAALGYRLGGLVSRVGDRTA
jgi:hypothetical protein